MKKRRILGLTALLCAAFMLAGCAEREEAGNKIIIDESADNGSGARQEGEKDAAGTQDSAGAQEAGKKGRYVEKELTMPDAYYASGGMGAYQIRELEDGSLAVLDQNLQRFVSKDRGNSWEQLPDNGLSSIVGKHYVTGAALSADGSVGVAYCVDSQSDTQDSIGLKVSDELIYHYLYASPEGTVRELDLREADLDSYLSSFFGFAPDGRLLGSSPRGGVYAVSTADDKAVKLFEAAGSVGYGKVRDNRLYVSTSGGMAVYDLESGELQEADEVLNQYMAEHVSEIGGTSDTYQLVQDVDGDTLYLAYTGGVFAYDMTAPENGVTQVIDGALSSFGNPSVYLRDFTRLSDGSFAAAFYGGALSLFTYDPDMAFRPEKEMSIYSLYENDVIRQAAAMYMKGDPEVYVNVQAGLTTSDLESGKTAEDAIKNLNTKILAGDGPDLLVMDDLPYESYLEKGVLQDIAPLLTESAADVLPNIRQAFTEENGEIHMLPLRYALPVVFGPEETVKRIRDMTTLADAVEELRAGRAEDQVISNYALLEKEMLDLLSVPSASAWVQDGKLQEAALAEFLTQAKRIYDAQVSGISEERLESFRENRWETAPGEKNYTNDTGSSCWPGAEMYPGSLAIGTIDDFGYGFSKLTSVMEKLGGLDYAQWQGQAGNCFIPGHCIALSAQAPHPEAAGEFLQYLFSLTAQSAEGQGGFPVSGKALEAAIESVKQQGAENRNEETDERGALGWLGSGSSDGSEHYELMLVPAMDTEFARIREMLYAAETPCMADRNLKAIVLEAGEKVLSGEAGVEEGIAEIKKQAAIYLAE